MSRTLKSGSQPSLDCENGVRPRCALGVKNPIWRLGALVFLLHSIGKVILVLKPDRSLSLKASPSCDPQGKRFRKPKGLGEKPRPNNTKREGASSRMASCHGHVERELRTLPPAHESHGPSLLVALSRRDGRPQMLRIYPSKSCVPPLQPPITWQKGGSRWQLFQIQTN